jgi:uncharacterized protein (DUF1330 family)
MNLPPRYLDPTQDAGRAFVMRGIAGPVMMLNLLRFRDIADYSHAPQLAPPEPVTGRQAFDRYVASTLPCLTASGGEIVLMGDGGPFLIGPPDERWDLAMVIRQASVDAFMSFLDDEGYMAGLAHRTAALEDSRLLPLVPMALPG